MTPEILKSSIEYVRSKVEEMKNEFPRYEDEATKHLDEVIQAAESTLALNGALDVAVEALQMYARQEDNKYDFASTPALKGTSKAHSALTQISALRGKGGGI